MTDIQSLSHSKWRCQYHHIGSARKGGAVRETGGTGADSSQILPVPHSSLQMGVLLLKRKESANGRSGGAASTCKSFADAPRFRAGARSDKMNQ